MRVCSSYPSTFLPARGFGGTAGREENDRGTPPLGGPIVVAPKDPEKTAGGWV